MAKIQIRKRPSIQSLEEDIDEYEKAAEDFEKAVAEDYGNGDDEYEEEEYNDEETPSLADIISQLSDKETSKIDRIFDDPDFFYSLGCSIAMASNIDGASEDILGKAIADICQLIEADTDEFIDGLDIDNFDIDEAFAKFAKLPTSVKGYIMVTIGSAMEECDEDDEEAAYMLQLLESLA